MGSIIRKVTENQILKNEVEQWSNGAGEAILGHIESEVVENGEMLCMISLTETDERSQKANDLTAKKSTSA